MSDEPELEAPPSAVRPRGGEAPPPILGRPIRVVSVGLDLFADTLEREALPVVRLAWDPGADSERRIASILKALT